MQACRDQEVILRLSLSAFSLGILLLATSGCDGLSIDCDDADPDRKQMVFGGGVETVCDDGLDDDCDSFIDGDGYDCNPCASNEDCDDGVPDTADICEIGQGCFHLLV